MDSRTEELLKDYRKSVEKLARTAYLQTLALKREVETTPINVEDRQSIILHCIGLLTGRDSNKSLKNAQDGNA